MNTSLKVILSAIGIAVLASPVMAQSTSNPNHMRPAAIANAHGSVARAQMDRMVRGYHDDSPITRVYDCVHVTFPQCGGDPTQVDPNRP